MGVTTWLIKQAAKHIPQIENAIVQAAPLLKTIAKRAIGTGEFIAGSLALDKAVDFVSHHIPGAGSDPSATEEAKNKSKPNNKRDVAAKPAPTAAGSDDQVPATGGEAATPTTAASQPQPTSPTNSSAATETAQPAPSASTEASVAAAPTAVGGGDTASVAPTSDPGPADDAPVSAGDTSPAAAQTPDTDPAKLVAQLIKNPDDDTAKALESTREDTIQKQPDAVKKQAGMTVAMLSPTVVTAEKDAGDGSKLVTAGLKEDGQTVTKAATYLVKGNQIKVLPKGTQGLDQLQKPALTAMNQPGGPTDVNGDASGQIAQQPPAQNPAAASLSMVG